MYIPSPYENLLKNMTADEVIITVTHRLANFLIDNYAELKSAEGELVWRKPTIFSFSTWLKQLWDQIRLYTNDCLLSESQEHALWQTVIQNTSFSSLSLEAIRVSAKLAAEAASLIQSHQLAFCEGSGFTNHRQFYAWYTAFQKICHEKNWITRAELPCYLGKKFQKAEFRLPKKIILVGFNELSKANQAFLTELQNLDVVVENYVANPVPGQVTRIEIDTVEEEVLVMARWAKQIFQMDPEKNLIGCIVPKLEQRRSEVLNAFRQVFFNEMVSLSSSDIFDLSAPIPLAEISLISIALRLFELGENTLSLENVGVLLRSPFIGAAQQEWLSRTFLYNHLRNLNHDQIVIEKLLELANAVGRSFYCPDWFKRLTRFRNLLQEFDCVRFFPSQWAEKFSDVLDIIGWPGERGLTNEENKIVEEFKKVLKSFAGLDMILSKISWEKAKLQLTDMLSQRLFQAPYCGVAPIQILGTLEAVGIPFTHVWVLGLTDDVWPLAPRPHPLIPLNIQVQFELPHSSAKRELEFSQLLTRQFCQMAHNIILSSAHFNGDIEQRPSRLLSQFSVIDISSLDLGESLVKFSNASHFEYLQDDFAPSIPLGESIKGGAYLFKLQSACPFRAFAEIRLQAKVPDKTRLHLNAKEKGSMIHRVLEAVWRKLQNHQQLMTLSQEALHQLVENAVDVGLCEFSDDVNGLHLGFNRVERKRIIRLVNRWLEYYEKPRPAFRIHALESVEKVELAGQQYTFKMDRVDELIDSGQKIVIDYKTGYVSKEDWFGERLNEPQLPLYCVASQIPISGLLFAQIKTSQLLYKGISQEGVDIEGVQLLSSEAWSKQTMQWKIDLENLATQFSQGYAKVDPKETATCRFCQLKMLCRVGQCA